MCGGGGGGGGGETESGGTENWAHTYQSQQMGFEVPGSDDSCWGVSFVAILAVKHGYESAIFHPLLQRFPLRSF